MSIIFQLFLNWHCEAQTEPDMNVDYWRVMYESL